MGGLAKSAEEQTPVTPPVYPVADVKNIVEKDAPYDVYSFFGKDPYRTEDSDKSKLLAIYEYASNQVPVSYRTPGNIMAKLAELKRNLGAPRLDESVLTKLYTYIRLSNNIDDLFKQREAIRG